MYRADWSWHSLSQDNFYHLLGQDNVLEGFDFESFLDDSLLLEEQARLIRIDALSDKAVMDATRKRKRIDSDNEDVVKAMSAKGKER